MTSHPVTHPAPRKEFIVLVALLSALVAMSIDSMLPAMEQIATGFGVVEPNRRQFILTSFFIGMSMGTLIYGPLSDSIGRKPAIFAGLSLFLAGSLLCSLSTSFNMLLLGRFLQGLGVASPRIVSMAMVRDGVAGAAMARVMSFVMSVFMLVPIFAPFIGQLIMKLASWRMIFVALMLMGLVAALFLFFRQEETLPRERRRALSLKNLVQAAGEFFRCRKSWCYTFAVGFIFASFTAYLGTSQQIFVDQYQQGDRFPLWFGLFAVALALAMIMNGKLVMRAGMRHLTKYGLRAFIVNAAVYFGICLFTHGHPPLWSLAIFMSITFFCSGLLFGNYNAMAMEPMGRIAGMASAISGSLSSLIALTLGTLMGFFYDGSMTPLVAGYLIMGLLALLATEAGERWKPKAAAP